MTPQSLVLIFAATTGALVGSFLNVVIYRLPAGLSIVHPRSRCPKCLTPIPSWLNIPILSWILLRGRCYTCKTPISARYPAIELCTAAVWGACAVRFGLSWALFTAVLLASSLIAITFIDIDTWEIPDEISLPGIVLGAVLRPLTLGAPWYDGIAGAVVGALVLYVIRALGSWYMKQEAMGLGDIKLIAMIGAFLGLSSLLPVILLASLSGTVIGGILLLTKRPDETPAAPPAGPETSAKPETEGKEEDEDDWVPAPTAVPFGPFLALGGLAQLLTGNTALSFDSLLGRITQGLFT